MISEPIEKECIYGHKQRTNKNFCQYRPPLDPHFPEFEPEKCKQWLKPVETRGTRRP